MSDKLWIPGQPDPDPIADALIMPGQPEPAAPAAPSPSAPEADAGVPDSAPPKTAPDAEATQAQAQQMQQFLQSLRYPPRPVSATCPQCSTQISSLVFPIQDYGANPGLLSMFLSGQMEHMMCPACKNGLALQSPVLVHLPQREFLGVVVPDAANSQASPQTVIGQLASEFMARVPRQERKGYMLTPKQFMSVERLRDALWEFQGVTREMRRRQQAQMELLQRMLAVHEDQAALQEVATAHTELLDRDFTLRIAQMGLQASGEEEGAEALRTIASYLMQNTTVGKRIQAQQARIQKLGRQMQQGMDMATQASVLATEWSREDGSDVVLTLVQALPQRFGYEFLLELSTLIELETDAAKRTPMEAMRTQIDAAMKALMQQQAQLQQNIYQASVSLVSGALESEDPAALLRSQMPLLRGPFIPVLMNMISQAEKNRARDVVARLLQLRDLALEIQAQTMPDEDRFLFRLITARTVAETRALMEENRTHISQALLDKMQTMERELRENDMEQQARKIKSLRGQLALMR